MKVHKAIIPIQNLNCKNCAIELANKLSEINYISHLGLDYKSSEVYFNFKNIMGVADVENMLTDLGFNPLGEKIKHAKSNTFFCQDASINLCIHGL